MVSFLTLSVSKVITSWYISIPTLQTDFAQNGKRIIALSIPYGKTDPRKLYVALHVQFRAITY